VERPPTPTASPLAAVGIVYERLRVAYRKPKDLEAREQMSLAATYAGLAFTRANVGYVHAIAHQLGGKYHVPHGLANAIMLPHVLRFLSPAITRRLALLAVRAGVGKPGGAAGGAREEVHRFGREPQSRRRHSRAGGCVARGGHPRAREAACWEADTNYPVPRYMSPDTCAGILRGVLPPLASAVRQSAGHPCASRHAPARGR